jgi:hypothetical protein
MDKKCDTRRHRGGGESVMNEREELSEQILTVGIDAETQEFAALMSQSLPIIQEMSELFKQILKNQARLDELFVKAIPTSPGIVPRNLGMKS